MSLGWYQVRFFWIIFGHAYGAWGGERCLRNAEQIMKTISTTPTGPTPHISKTYVPKKAIKWGDVWRTTPPPPSKILQWIWCTNRLLWHIGPDFYAIRLNLDFYIPYEPNLLGWSSKYLALDRFAAYILANKFKISPVRSIVKNNPAKMDPKTCQAAKWSKGKYLNHPRNLWGWLLRGECSTRVKWVPFVLLAFFPWFIVFFASKLAIFPLKRSVLGAWKGHIRARKGQWWIRVPRAQNHLKCR